MRRAPPRRIGTGRPGREGYPSWRTARNISRYSSGSASYSPNIWASATISLKASYASAVSGIRRHRTDRVDGGDASGRRESPPPRACAPMSDAKSPACQQLVESTEPYAEGPRSPPYPDASLPRPASEHRPSRRKAQSNRRLSQDTGTPRPRRTLATGASPLSPASPAVGEAVGRLRPRLRRWRSGRSGPGRLPRARRSRRGRRRSPSPRRP